MDVNSTKFFSSRTLRNFCIQILKKVNVPSIEAELFAETLIKANLRGIDSHGVTRLPIYVQRIMAGGIRVPTEIKFTQDSGPISVIDGNNGIPQVVAIRAMKHTVGKTKKWGVGITTVKNVDSFGAAAYYSMIALESHFVGIVFSNGYPSGIAPLGGKVPMLGTNPISVSIPAGRQLPIVLDMATSVAARGKIMLAAKERRHIPEGWALNKKGCPTTDPQEALEGSVLPFGGAKGYAISLIIDILAGIMGGAAFGPYINSLYGDRTIPQNVGYFMLSLNVSRFIPLEEFRKKVDDLIVRVKNCPKAPGVSEIFLPGEIEFRTEEKRARIGIALSNEVREDLASLANKIGVRFSL